MNIVHIRYFYKGGNIFSKYKHSDYVMILRYDLIIYWVIAVTRNEFEIIKKYSCQLLLEIRHSQVVKIRRIFFFTAQILVVEAVMLNVISCCITFQSFAYH